MGKNPILLAVVTSASCLICAPSLLARRRSEIKGLVRHRRRGQRCLRAQRRRPAQTKRYSDGPTDLQTGPGPEMEGVSARGKKNSFVVVIVVGARGVFCDGEEAEGGGEAQQSATSKSILAPARARLRLNDGLQIPWTGVEL